MTNWCPGFVHPWSYFIRLGEKKIGTQDLDVIR